MTIRVPHFAEDWKDQGILTFTGFCLRVCEQYGYGEWYTMSGEDASVICNKRQSGLIQWLREVGVGPIELGQPYTHTIMFRLHKPPQKRSVKKIANVELTDLRQQKVWLYILGCLNHNLMSDTVVSPPASYRPNTYHITEFNIDRCALGYIKIADRH